MSFFKTHVLVWEFMLSFLVYQFLCIFCLILRVGQFKTNGLGVELGPSCNFKCIETVPMRGWRVESATVGAVQGQRIYNMPISRASHLKISRKLEFGDSILRHDMKNEIHVHVPHFLKKIPKISKNDLFCCIHHGMPCTLWSLLRP